MSTANETAKPNEDQKGVSAPSISLPKGGGAIRGMGEKFATNPVTGTGSMSVPLAVSPGRAGFGPQLALSYDSGAGNGPFGFGWSLSLPAITRKTDKGLPRYFDDEESDVFILSGAEDLVPELKKDANGDWVLQKGSYVIHDEPRTVDNTTYQVRRYRPRIEGLFARIERWTNDADPTDMFWRSISRDNVTTWYGKTPESRVIDPAEPTRIFSWLICQSHDDKGNVLVYNYKAEDSSGIALSQAHERNRNDTTRQVQRYLKRIRYGNRTPYFPIYAPNRPTTPLPADTDWLFEVVFDYGEHDANAPMPIEASAWPARNDPFSSYRAGFEVRTYRLCQRVLMFHHIPDLATGEKGYEGLVRSTDFTYSYEQAPTDARNPIYSFLLSVQQCGYKRPNGVYLKRGLPPLEFEYTKPKVHEAVEELDAEDVDAESLVNLPIGVDGAAYQWTDLHGEGVPGILTEQAGAWFYKRNLSPLSEKTDNGKTRVQAHFAPAELVAARPNLGLAAGAQFMDLAGDGQPDLVVLDGPMPGFYEHNGEEGWQPFHPFSSRLARDTRDPNLKFVDLDGDGHADVLISEDDVFVWHPSLAEQGFGPANRIRQALDEEKGPRLVFADGTQSVYLADLSGDGLTDLARIRNGEVCYWPNLGYGRFGAKVTMDNAPRFDNPDQFDQKRVRLADIDGSGTTDIIYLHRDGVRLHFNQSGNNWSAPVPLRAFPRVDDLVAIAATDLLGNGTACLVWSSPLPGDARRPMRYVNLMGGQKPHLLVKTANNLGAETWVTYAPSTKFYLKDKQAGRPWITRLPFPVHVVEKVTTYDHISRNRFVTCYAYHHGYFDGEEREFRGFGMVEQTDTEEFAAFTATGAPPSNADEASHVPPVLTRTWFHTGVYLGRDQVSNYFAGLVDGSDRGEYYREPAWLDDYDEARKRLLPDTILPSGLTLDEEREAARSLKGMMLRQEVYARDGVGVTSDYPNGQPYTVAEQNFTVRPLQPRGGNRHAVLFSHPREAITYHYEREPQDPRIQHALTLEVDDYGNVLKQATIGYGRRASPLATQWDRDRQTTPLLTYTENRVTNAFELPDTHRNPLPCEVLTFELTGYPPTGSADRYRASDFVEPDPNAAGRLRHKFTGQVSYEDAATGNLCRRPIEWLRTLYRRDDLSGLLPLGDLQPLALPGESYKLALTSGLLTQVFQRPRTGQPAEPLLPDPARAAVLGGKAGNQGGYVDLDGDASWWIPSGRSFYHPNAVAAAVELAEARAHFFLPRRYRDPFGHNAFVDFDANDLLMVETRDALGNRVTVDVNDYRVLQPRLVSDPNRNRTEVAFDALGLVAGTAVMGKPADNPPQGDNLDSLFQPDLTQTQIDDFVTQPRQPHPTEPASQATPIVHTLLGNATTRIVYDLDRFKTLGEPPFAATIARETHVGDLPAGQQSKLQISFSYSDGFGREIQKKIQAEPGPLDVAAPQAPVVNPRWVGSGWTIFNNKGKPVRQYEPFFSATHHFEFGVMVGVSPVLFYDPAERVVVTLHPNHTWEKVVFDPWRQETWDVNDTVLIADPKTDADVSNFFGRLPNAEYLPTWHALRTDAAHAAAFAARYPDATDRANETRAAVKASIHAATPTVAHADSLGRTFLTVAHNKAKYGDTPAAASPIEEFHTTRIVLDIEGNQREVIDAKDRIVMRYAYDMLGNRIHQLSMEAGARWTLSDVAGKPIRAWDSRGHNFITTYDALRRPVEQFARGTAADSDPRTLNPPNADGLLVDKIEYGEGVANAEALNLRTRIYRHFDSAGVATNARLDAGGDPAEAYDFKGNLLRSTRRLVSNYKTIPNWLLSPQLEAEFFEGSTRYDALNRPIQSIAPHSSLTRVQHPNKFNVIQPVFNEANLLERVDVWLERAAEPPGLLAPATEPPSPVGVSDIDYDAKGQRTLIDYKTRDATVIRTTYTYDCETFRLTHLYTRRGVNPVTAQGVAFTEDCENPNPTPATIAAPEQPPTGKVCGLQNLHYTYDPAGNITHIRDDAQQTVYFSNRRVEPSAEYTYDAIYRLIEGTGREHLGQTAGQRNPPSPPDVFNSFHTRLDHPSNGDAMGTYIEQYVYDAVGNFLSMQHRGNNPAHPGWTRSFDYDEDSLTEPATPTQPAKKSNRLSKAALHSDPPSAVKHFTYDAHGNMTRMPHLPLMRWDYRDQLQTTAQQVVTNGIPETTYFVYDAGGQRVRKITERAVTAAELASGKKPTRMKERIYLGGFEIYRETNGSAGMALVLERETLHIMDEKQRIALVETKTSTPPETLIRYQVGNHLGSASLELDDQSQIISYEEYAPYGSSTYQAVRSQTETPKRYRYTGKERDEESGLYYHGARYFAPWIGWWISCDPIGLGDHLNLYTYVRNNPLTMKDPSGRQGEPTKEIVIPNTFTGKETVEELHAFARKHGYDFKGAPKWIEERGSWDVGQLHHIHMGSDASRKPQVVESEAKDSAKTAGQGTVTTYNAAQRAEYQRKIKTRSGEAVEKIKELRESKRSGAAVEAWEEGKSASAVREAARDAAREKLSPSGKALSEQIDQTKPFDYYADKYSSPPETRASIGKGNPPIKPSPQTANAFQVAEDVAKGAGKSRGGVSGLALRAGKWLGPIGIGVGLGLAAHEIAEAPPAQRGRVSSRESGAFFGGLLGAELGAGAGVALAGGISGFLIGLGVVSGPIGWLAIGLAIVGGIAGAWAFGKLFGNVGEGAYDLAQ